MKHLIASIFFILVFTIPVLPQVHDFDVKGIRVGTRYKEVIGKLGKPASIREALEYPCDDNSPTMTRLSYKGLVIDLIPSNNEKEGLFVAAMEVTGTKWLISSQIRTGDSVKLISSKIRIGTSVKKVRQAFGGKLRREGSIRYLSYYNGDGYASFYFRRNRLVKAEWELNTC